MRAFPFLVKPGLPRIDAHICAYTVLVKENIAVRISSVLGGAAQSDATLRAMLRWGTINEHEYGLLEFADTVDQAFDRVRAAVEKYHMKLDTDLQE